MQFLFQSTTWLSRRLFQDWRFLDGQGQKTILFHLLELLMNGTGRGAYWARTRVLWVQLYDLLAQVLVVADRLAKPLIRKDEADQAKAPGNQARPTGPETRPPGTAPPDPGGRGAPIGTSIPGRLPPERIISALK